jgi:hypothetical protein
VDHQDGRVADGRRTTAVELDHRPNIYPAAPAAGMYNWNAMNEHTDPIPVPAAGVVTQEMPSAEALKSEAVLILPRQAQIKVLNEVAAFVWKRLDGKRSVEELISLVTEEYDVSGETARRDVTAFLESLAERGMIHWAGTP